MSPLIFKMATIHNTDLTKELKEGAKLQQLRDVIPSQLADKVVPVMEVNPKLLRRANILRGISKTTTGAQTIYTTPADKDFYLTGVTFAISKNVTCDVASGRAGISLTIDGASQVLSLLSLQTLTASDQTTSLTINPPLKVDRNTAISSGGGVAFTAGAMATTSSVIGYLVENINA